jgi:hypothetical protein
MSWTPAHADPCERCAALERELDRLRREVERLRRERSNAADEVLEIARAFIERVEGVVRERA